MQAILNFFTGPLNTVAWLYIFLPCVMIGGVLLTVRTGFIQFRRFGYAMKNTAGKMFKKAEAGHGAVTPLQAVTTALAATVGTGNIVGTSQAIALGGYGAVFWLWLAALMGMVVKYSEVTLSVHYRQRDAHGDWVGGPMYYITNGMGAKWKWLAVVFAIFAVLASFGIGNMSQINSIAGNMNAAFGVPTLVTGLCLMVVTALIVIGGLKRVAAVTEKLVPIMALFYIIGCVIILVMNASAIPNAFVQIFTLAFQPQAIAGGVAGVTVQQAMRYGVARGLFSNEAGLGSTPHAHALAKVKQPQDQGALAIIGVFVDTFVILTLTALVLITSGLIPEGMTGTALTQAAFSLTFGSFGKVFIAICMLFFAFSTILGWYFFGQVNFNALFGSKYTKVYSLIVVLFILIGSSLKVDLVWALADFFNGLMAVPNLLALLALSGVVAGIARNKKD